MMSSTIITISEAFYWSALHGVRSHLSELFESLVFSIDWRRPSFYKHTLVKEGSPAHSRSQLLRDIAAKLFLLGGSSSTLSLGWRSDFLPCKTIMICFKSSDLGGQPYDAVFRVDLGDAFRSISGLVFLMAGFTYISYTASYLKVRHV